MANSKITGTVKAEDVPEGAFLPNLDDGYVIDVEEDPDITMNSSRYSFGVGDGMVLITFHDKDGEENYLLLNKEHPVDIRYEA
jgi:hypothetical protein